MKHSGWESERTVLLHLCLLDQVQTGGRPVVQRDWLPVIVNLSPHSAMWAWERACVCARPCTILWLCEAQRKGSGCVVRNFKGGKSNFVFSLVSYIRDGPLSLTCREPPMIPTIWETKPITSMEKEATIFHFNTLTCTKGKGVLCEPKLALGWAEALLSVSLKIKSTSCT